MVFWRGWCGTLKRVVWFFEEDGVVLWVPYCIADRFSFLSLGLEFPDGILKRVMWYFEEGGLVLKRDLWYFVIIIAKNTLNYLFVHSELMFFYFYNGAGIQQAALIKWCSEQAHSDTNVQVYWIEWWVLWRWWYGTLKRVVWYFEDGGVILWRRWCDTLKRVVWNFEEGGGSDQAHTNTNIQVNYGEYDRKVSLIIKKLLGADQTLVATAVCRTLTNAMLFCRLSVKVDIHHVYLLHYIRTRYTFFTLNFYFSQLSLLWTFFTLYFLHYIRTRCMSRTLTNVICKCIQIMTLVVRCSCFCWIQT